MNLLPRTAEVDGNITFEGDDVRAVAKERRKHFWGVKMTMVFQDPMTSLNPVKRCGEQITETLRYHLGDDKRQPRRRPSTYWNRSASPSRPSAPINTRTNFPAVASASRDRDGACLRAITADRRRAHDCRRRDGTKAPP